MNAPVRPRPRAAHAHSSPNILGRAHRPIWRELALEQMGKDLRLCSRRRLDALKAVAGGARLKTS